MIKIKERKVLGEKAKDDQKERNVKCYGKRRLMIKINERKVLGEKSTDDQKERNVKC